MVMKVFRFIPLVMILFCWSCQNKNEDDQSVYAAGKKMSLKGTKWKLVGIAETSIDNLKVQTDELKVLKPQNCSDFREVYGDGLSCGSFVERSYTLSFDTENLITGYITSKYIMCSYDVDYKTYNMCIYCLFETTLVEFFDDGVLYGEILSTVQSFSFTNRELRLYFNDNKNYLLFKPKNE